MWRPSPSSGTRSSETSSMPARSLAGSPWRNGASPHCGGSLCRCYASRACRASVPSSGSSALGAGERLVGVCAQCDYPAAVASVPRVGGYLVPSVEVTLAARPDLVIAVPSPGNREAVRAIERAGVRVLVVHDRTLAELWDSI